MMKNKEDTVAFYIASSNQEILKRIDNLMAERGILGFKDPRGRYHYLVDGRKGAPYALRHIDDTARRLLRKRESDDQRDGIQASFYVDAVLDCYGFNKSLKGFHLLRSLLIQLILHPSLRNPLSKSLYPLIAEAYHMKAKQVERNIRYCLDQLRESEKKLRQEQKTASFSGRGVAPVRILFEEDSSYSNSRVIQILERKVRTLIRQDVQAKKEAASPDSPLRNN